VPDPDSLAERLIKLAERQADRDRKAGEAIADNKNNSSSILSKPQLDEFDLPDQEEAWHTYLYQHSGINPNDYRQMTDPANQSPIVSLYSEYVRLQGLEESDGMDSSDSYPRWRS
jgi:hypothetical protein